MPKDEGIQWESVVSTNLSKIGWSEEDQTLYIQFRNGAVYSYEAPYDVFTGLRDAASAGRYFNDYVKNQYPGSRL